MGVNQIVWHLFENNDPFNTGMLLHPEVASHYGMTLDDIEMIFSKAFHFTAKRWTIIVVDMYLINGRMELIEEQLEELHTYYLDNKLARTYEFKKLSPKLYHETYMEQ